MALGYRRRDLLGRAVAECFHRVDVAQQHNLGAHLLPGLGQRHHRVDVDDFATQASDTRQDAADVAADVQPHFRAHRVQAVDQLLFVGADELVVDLRADQRGGGVAHADQVHARIDLGPSELAAPSPIRNRTSRGQRPDRRRNQSSAG